MGGKKIIGLLLLCVLCGTAFAETQIGILFPWDDETLETAAKAIQEAIGESCGTVLYAEGALEYEAERLLENGCTVLIMSTEEIPKAISEDAYIVDLLRDSPNADFVVTEDPYLVGASQALALLQGLGEERESKPYTVEIMLRNTGKGSLMQYLGYRDVLKPYINRRELMTGSGIDTFPETAIDNKETADALRERLLTYDDENFPVALLTENEEIAQEGLAMCAGKTVLATGTYAFLEIDMEELTQKTVEAALCLLNGNMPESNDETDSGVPAWMIETSALKDSEKLEKLLITQ